MSARITGTVVAAGLLSVGGAPLAAPVQDRPGMPTKAQVWVENRGRTEAIPVTLQDVAADVPVSVEVRGTARVALAPGAGIEARLVRQPWEYRTVSLRAGQDVAEALDAAGADGWEAAAVQPAGQGGLLVIMKRPQ